MKNRKEKHRLKRKEKKKAILRADNELLRKTKAEELYFYGLIGWGPGRQTRKLQLKQVIRTDPDFIPAYAELASLCIKDEEFAEAIPPLLTLTERGGDPVGTYLDLSLCYYHLNRYDDALVSLQKALHLIKQDRTRSRISQERRRIIAERLKELRKLRAPQRQNLVAKVVAPVQKQEAAVEEIIFQAEDVPFSPPRSISIEVSYRFEKNPVLLDSLRSELYSPLPAHRLREEAEILSFAENFDELLCLGTLKEVEHFWYQIETAKKILRRFRGRALLCDEVGLGKTIEAGLVLKEYLVRGLVRNVLILVPPSLVSHWRGEMLAKFDLHFVTTEDTTYSSSTPSFWHDNRLVIASINTAKSRANRDIVSQIDYDMVIVDEAHHLKNRSTLNWKLVNSLKKKFILLLTATPVQNHLMELYNLITLLKPGQLATAASFKREFVEAGDPRLPKNRMRLRELLSEVMIRNTRSLAGIKLPKRYATTISIEPSPEEEQLYSLVSQLTRAHSDVFRRRTQTDGMPRACAQPARRRCPECLDVPTQQELPLTWEPTTPSASDFPAETVPEEHAPHHTSPSNTAMDTEATGRMPLNRFTLTLMQMEAGSSPLAVLRTAERLLRREDSHVLSKELSLIYQTAQLCRTSSKFEKLVEILSQTNLKKIVFSHFKPTIELISRGLSQIGIQHVLFHGDMSATEKEESISRFRNHVDVLVSTELGGEGRNLQFCNTMINFDLPWNPMRLEQRIGRIHRIGQKRDVFIFNLCSRGSIEEYLLDILDRKINMFELTLGEIDMILGFLDEEREFSDLVMEAWVQSSKPDEIDAAFSDLGERLMRAREQYFEVKKFHEEIFRQDYEM